MLNLATHEPNRVITRNEIGQSEGISTDYVEQILIKLKSARLVQSQRGIHGGFHLARPAQSITIKDIVVAIEGPIAIVPCASKPCSRLSRCLTANVWDQATQALTDVLESSNLAQLARMATDPRAGGYDI